MEPATQVLVAEAVESLVPLGQEAEQLVVLLLPGIEAAVVLAVLADAVAGRCNDFFELFLDLGDRHRLAIPLVALIAQFTPAVQVADAFAHSLPRGRTIGVIRRRAKHLEVPRVVDRRFDPQDAAAFVVHLDRVAIHPVLDPKAFMELAAVGHHLSRNSALDPAGGTDVFSTEVPHHRGTVADAHRMVQPRRVDRIQRRTRLE
jgi:hypothetical protein